MKDKPHIQCRITIDGHPFSGRLFWKVVIADNKGNASGVRTGHGRTFVDAAAEAFEAASRMGATHIRQRRPKQEPTP